MNLAGSPIDLSSFTVDWAKSLCQTPCSSWLLQF